MITDAIDLREAHISHSPDVAGWMPTIRITRVSCTAAGGFVIEFDRPVPDRWKWFTGNPANPNDNYQWTVWMIVHVAGAWLGAALVPMWQGRTMGDRAIPPLFADVDGAPGWTRLWGDVRRPWGAMSDYVPQAGEAIGILVTAGNGRLTSGVDLEHGLSVRERSNVVTFTLHADDSGDVIYLDDGPVTAPDHPPATPGETPDPPDLRLEARLATIEAQLAQVLAMKAPTYEGTVAIPAWLGTGKVTLTPKATP
jgi:hypothetical protein